MKKIFDFLSHPITDIVGGYLIVFVSLFLCVNFCDFDKSHIFAWIAGLLYAVGSDCIYHGFDQFKLHKSSAPADEVK